MDVLVFNYTVRDAPKLEMRRYATRDYIKKIGGEPLEASVRPISDSFVDADGRVRNSL